jgi:ABC-type transporter Mla MlaB component
MIFRLPSELLVYQVFGLQQELLIQLDQMITTQGVSHGSFQLLANEVAEVDAAGLQLLVALKHECSNRAVHFQIDNASPSFRQACHDFGLETFLLKSSPEGQAFSVAGEALK